MFSSSFFSPSLPLLILALLPQDSQSPCSWTFPRFCWTPLILFSFLPAFPFLFLSFSHFTLFHSLVLPALSVASRSRHFQPLVSLFSASRKSRQRSTFDQTSTQPTTTTNLPPPNDSLCWQPTNDQTTILYSSPSTFQTRPALQSGKHLLWSSRVRSVGDLQALGDLLFAIREPLPEVDRLLTLASWRDIVFRRLIKKKKRVRLYTQWGFLIFSIFDLLWFVAL